MYTTVNGAKLYFDITGSGLRPIGNAMHEVPALVSLHASYLDHSYLKPSLSKLADYCQIIHLDFRGSGRSTRDAPDTWHLDQLAKDLLALLDILGHDRVALLGHSWGCHVAATLNNIAPERIRANILLNPVFFVLNEYLARVSTSCNEEGLVAAKAVLLERNTDFLDSYLELLSPLLFRTPVPAEMFARILPGPEFFLQSLDELLRIDLASLLQTERLTAPTLVLHGAYDPYRSERSKACLKTLGTAPHFNIVECSGSSHFVLHDEEDKALSLIRNLLSDIHDNE